MKYTSSRYFEIMPQQGRTPTVTPGTGATQIQFLLNSIPTQKDSKFWYYVRKARLKLKCTVTLPTDSTFVGLTPEARYRALSSLEVTTPILGTLFATQNTRGTVLGNVIGPISQGYNTKPYSNLLGAGGNTTVNFEVVYDIPFAQEFLANPMDSAPWAGLLEGGYINVNIAPSTVFAATLAGAVLTSVTASVSLAMQPEPEPRVHTPVQYREHIMPGGSTRFTVTDMGSPDGLQGIDQSMGVGIAGLAMLLSPTSNLVGLDGGTTADNITQFNIPWRDQNEILDPEIPIFELLDLMNGARRTPGGALSALSDMAWPYILSTAVPAGNAVSTSFQNTGLMIYPLVMPGAGLFTSKAQTVAGAKEINMQFTNTPSASQRFIGIYLPVFDEQFAKSLAARIAPGSEGKFQPKLLNKQDPNKAVRRVGKIAYTPDKITG
jgi:hypothetical protein